MFVDHSSIHRWAIRFLPLFENIFRQYMRPTVGRELLTPTENCPPADFY
jgi:transposase-like protein